MTEQTGQEPRIAIAAKTPNGYPVKLEVFTSTTRKQAEEFLSMVERFAEWLELKGWKPDADPPAPSPVESAGDKKMMTGNNYEGLTCSPMSDVLGYPEWIQASDGSIHTRKEENGDVWYSYDTGETKPDGKKIYQRLFTVKKGETPPHKKEK